MIAQEVLNYFNEISGRKFRAVKTNLKPIEARLKDGYSVQEIKEVIQLKTLEWKNNEVMSMHLCPTTIFRPSNFEKYINQVEVVKQNPEQYAKYFAKINRINITAANDIDGLNELYGD